VPVEAAYRHNRQPALGVRQSGGRSVA
jgi:hypothetical protein